MGSRRQCRTRPNQVEARTLAGTADGKDCDVARDNYAHRAPLDRSLTTMGELGRVRSGVARLTLLLYQLDLHFLSVFKTYFGSQSRNGHWLDGIFRLTGIRCNQTIPPAYPTDAHLRLSLPSSSLPRRDHQSLRLVIFSLPPELPRCRGNVSDARRRAHLRNCPTM